MDASPGPLLGVMMRSLHARVLRWAGVVLGLALVVVFAPTGVGGAASYVIVSGDSMTPTFSDGDLVVVRSGDYVLGDVVAFDVGKGLVIHRIVGGSDADGFIVQGDNKTQPDLWHPTEDDVVGKEFVVLPGAGRLVLRVNGSPALFGVMIGGLGSLMVWSPRRKRKRRGAHAMDRPRRGPAAHNAVAVRRAGPVLLILAFALALLGGAATYLMVRQTERLGTVERTAFEHTGEYGYTAQVANSVVYESETIESPANGSEPTPIYLQLLRDLQIHFDYQAASPPKDMQGTMSAELRIGSGEGLWTRTVPLLDARHFDGAITSETFSIDIDRVQTMLRRAESETGVSPGLYQLVVMTKVTVESEGMPDEVFVAELPMELRDNLLLINNELVVAQEVTESAKAYVANDLEGFGLTVPLRMARALVGALFAMILVGGALYVAQVRHRIGKGEVAKIQLRYGSMIVPVVGAVPNGVHHVDVASMGDLVRLARNSEQLVFYNLGPSGDHLYFVPDGSVTYRYNVPPTNHFDR